MSWESCAWAARQQTGSPTRKLVLIMLANANGTVRGCFLGQKTISEHTELSETTVRRALKKLEEDGFITRNRRHRKDGSRTSDDYQFNMNNLPVAVTGSESDLPVAVTGPTGRCDRAILETLEEPLVNTPLGPLSEKPKRATTIPKDWELSQADIGYAVSKDFTPIEIDLQAEKFKSYWLANSGRNRLKLDWHQGWVNWIIKEVEYRNERNSKNNGDRNRSRSDQLVDELTSRFGSG